MVKKDKKSLLFWKTKSPGEMTTSEWESLCDGCSKCCLQKIEDEDTGNVFYTRIVCRHMDMKTCRCKHYASRTMLVPDCFMLRPQDVEKLHWLPQTCAYRLVVEGRDLDWWHPLISGNTDSVHEAGISVRGKVLSEEYVHPDGWYEHVIDWVD